MLQPLLYLSFLRLSLIKFSSAIHYYMASRRNVSQMLRDISYQCNVGLLMLNDGIYSRVSDGYNLIKSG